MIVAEDIRQAILKFAREKVYSFRPSDVARAIDEKNWHQLLDHVKLIANILVREGKLTTSGPSHNPRISLNRK
ncbi:MAG: DUF3253 domain-containing protein [Bacteroidota bacterium]